MNEIVLITGGARSGKSRYALEIASRYKRKVFVATAEPSDAEMRRRIKMHRMQRGRSCVTIEEPVNLAAAVCSLAGKADVAIVDCLTVWLGNLMHKGIAGKGVPKQVKAFLNTLRKPPCSLVLVTNEVGSGIVPANEMAREFRDLAGYVNREAASLADRVILTVCGIPVVIKG